MLGSNPDGLSCDGTVRSIVWDDSNGGTTGVSAAEDGVVRWWDLRTLKETSQLDLGESVTSMEMAHGGGTLSVTAGKKVHFLDILRYVKYTFMRTFRALLNTLSTTFAIMRIQLG